MSEKNKILERLEKALYIRLYNKDGKYINNHLWGFYSDLEIVKIFYNIIKNEY
jgi:hypothetical protein